MPQIFDNIDKHLLTALSEAMGLSERSSVARITCREVRRSASRARSRARARRRAVCKPRMHASTSLATPLQHSSECDCSIVSLASISKTAAALSH